MYNKRTIVEGIDYIGVNDRTTQRFENMFPLPDGVSYNSYILKAGKTCVMDTVDAGHTTQFMKNLDAALEGRDLDYLVVQHLEPDHCGSLELVLTQYPQAKFVGGPKTFTFFEQFFSDKFRDRYYLIKENDELDLGGFNLKFVFAPMVHWPEVFMTYETHTKTLFSADAFGAFGVIKGNLFVDEINYQENYISESRRYYANIVGRHGQAVQRLLAKVKDVEIATICPLHSLCFRTPETINFILDKYQKWSSFEAEEQGVVIAFASMYGNTALVMDILANCLAERGVRNIQMFDISQTQASYVIAETFRYNTVVFAAMNYNTELYVVMDALLTELVGCGFQNHKVALLGNMSWGGRALNIMQEHLAKAKNVELIAEPFVIQSSMKEAQIEALQGLADKIVTAIKA